MCTENEEAVELLFFDTFSHEENTDINLDLVQFPKPVFITQVRIIPLGARVQADFPGGVRLGATNPSKFGIEFFVNDLGMSGASTFEILGHFEYNQNDCIHLECAREKIPTDGLVLRGWYSTITLAVYGILTNAVSDPMASPPSPPCEQPTIEEKICSVSNEIPEIKDVVTVKEEWKEPLTSELARAKRTSVSDYECEREDVEFSVPPREIYHHSGDERERRLRKSSHSSDISGSSRNRTLSENNDRDFNRSRDRDRDKSGRDWSRSPDYPRRSSRKRSERSRVDPEDGQKWPRTPPPTSIDSPSRPRSPDNIAYVETPDDDHYKTKPRSAIPAGDAVGIAVISSAVDEDENPGTPSEQFELIVSDDEIIGDEGSTTAGDESAVDVDELELQEAAATNEKAIAEFDPFKEPLSKFTSDLTALYDKDVDSLRTIYKKLELQSKCGSVAQFKCSSTSVEERESYVFLSEQLINQLGYMSKNFKRRNYVLQRFFASQSNYKEQVFHILSIGLDFEAACLQLQPAFKIRHIKVGAKLAELLGPSCEFVDFMITEQQYDPFEALFGLYNQEYMALSIKLIILKAIYALLDSQVGLEHFLQRKTNGYAMLLEMIPQSHLTRTKYALQAIVKKLNLNEALACLHDNCQQMIASDHDNGAASTMARYQLLENAIDEVLEALTWNSLAFQQPKRFLPVSMKFKVTPDASAQRSLGNAMQAYFVNHAIGESLLLLIVNACELPTSLVARSLDLLEAMLHSHIGINYLVDDCFETSEMLVAILLGGDDLPANQAKPKDSMSKCEVDVAEAVPPSTGGDNPSVPIEDVILTDKQPSSAEESRPLDAALAGEKEKSPVVDERIVVPPEATLTRFQSLGVEMAFKIQTRYHLDAISHAASSGDYDAIALATHLHELYSQTCSHPGREHTVEIIGMKHNLQVFLDLVKREQRQMGSPVAKYKSPVLSYSVDMIDCCVRHCSDLAYLEEHGESILDLAKNHETFEPSVAAVLQEMSVYLRAVEAVNVFKSDEIEPLVEVITRSLEYITTFPGDLIMGLRILRHLVVGPVKSFKAGPAGSGSSSVGTGSDGNTKELKHRFAALQFFTAGGVQILLQILEKLCSYFEQPGLHAPTLVTIQGVHCAQIVLPTIQILRELLSFAIQCRDVDFKDLTAIDHLMRTFYLLHYFPGKSQATADVELAKKEIVQVLLAYTQPNELDENSLHRSLWTQMVREVMKNIATPFSFMPGLQVLSELLPLPLPIPLAPRSSQLRESQVQRLITERKLWSAHLHPLSSQISKLIETIAPTSFPPLTSLLLKVCAQLGDLAPNMSLLIAKTLSELLWANWSSNSSTATSYLCRLLNFFERLTVYASLKISALSIFNGKLWDLFQSVLSLKTAESSVDVAKCQASIHRILQNIFDTEISLISSQSLSSPELNLASTLPPKEVIPQLIDTILTNLVSVNASLEVFSLGLQNLTLLTEHDITFYHLSAALKQRSRDFRLVVEKSANDVEFEVQLSNIESLLLLLRSLLQIDAASPSPDIALPPRSLTLTADEVSLLIGYKSNPSVRQALQHMMQQMEKQKERFSESFLSDVEKVVKALEATEESSAAGEEASSSLAGQGTSDAVEPFLPQSEGIVTQFAARPIFIAYTTATPDEDDEATSGSPPSKYWLDMMSAAELWSMDENDLPFERVACDLQKLTNACLPPDTNLTTDCKRVLHLSASPQSNRERTPTAPCFRTRRVEVEPSTGRPEKKIYVTPVRGRGFSRAPPSRSDLFRSRPPNTSRPPSLHVDDFLALETCGAQPTGPTGYNKIPSMLRGGRVSRSRGSRISQSVAFRKSKLLRTSSPSWNDGGSPHYRSVSGESHFGSDNHYSPSQFSPRTGRGRGLRARPYMR